MCCARLVRIRGCFWGEVFEFRLLNIRERRNWFGFCLARLSIHPFVFLVADEYSRHLPEDIKYKGPYEKTQYHFSLIVFVLLGYNILRVLCRAEIFLITSLRNHYHYSRSQFAWRSRSATALPYIERKNNYTLRSNP